MPQLDVLVELLFGRYRGLLPISPILIFAIPGAWFMWRRRELRRDLIAATLVFVLLLLLNGGFNGWHGGLAIGPRYILQAIPFLAIPMLFATRFLRALWVIVGAASVAINLLVTAVNPTPSTTIPSPLDGYIIPMFLTGNIPSSTPEYPVYEWKIMPGHVSVNRQAPDEAYPYMKYTLGSLEAEWASFNVGEIWMEGSPWSILPIVLWMVAGSGVLLFMARGRVSTRSEPIVSNDVRH